MKAYRSRVMQKVFFSSAPVASTLFTSKGSLIGSGAYPRARRMMLIFLSATRVTESSVRI